MTWFGIFIEGATDTNLGATTLTEAIRIASETRAKMPNLRTLTILENGKQVWREQGFPLDLDECQRSSILVSGTNSMGKTQTACRIAEVLASQNWKIAVFDNSGAWRTKSSFPTFTLKPRNRELIPTKSPIIYDTSLLLPETQKRFIEAMLRFYWESRVNKSSQTWRIVFLEEMQLVAKNVRGIGAQQLLRIMSAGRNQKIRVCGITCDLALIDSVYIRLCQQRYHFRLGIEENGIRKFRAYYGKEATQIATKLTVGECLYLLGDELRQIKIPSQAPIEPIGTAL